MIKNKTDDALPDTPLQVKLKKECTMVRGTSKSTSKKQCFAFINNNNDHQIIIIILSLIVIFYLL